MMYHLGLTPDFPKGIPYRDSLVGKNTDPTPQNRFSGLTIQKNISRRQI